MDSGYFEAIRGEYGKRRIPYFLAGVDEHNAVLYLYPSPGDGTLVPVREPPAGLSYAVPATGYTMNGQLKGQRWLFRMHSGDLGYQITPLAGGPATELVRWGTDACPPIVNDFSIPHALDSLVSISSRLDLGSLEEMGQKASRSVANDISPIVVNNQDGTYDFLANLYMRGRPVLIQRGVDPDPENIGLTPFYRGVVDDLEWNDEQIVVRVTNPSEKFKNPLQKSFFRGTGNAEGTSLVADRPKDMLYGAPIFFEPTLIDEARLIYSLGDLPIASVAPGAPTAQVGIHFNDRFVELNVIFFNVFTWTQGAGSAAVDPTAALMRLGAAPQGRITASIYSGLGVSNRYHNPGEVIHDIVNRRMGLLATSVDQTSIDLVIANATQTVRLFFRGDQAWTCEEVLDTVCRQFGGIWGFSPVDGRFYTKQLSFDDPPVLVIDHTHMTPAGIRRSDPGLVPGHMRYSFNPTAGTYSENDVAPGAQGFNRWRARNPKIVGTRSSLSATSFPDLPTTEVDFQVAFSLDNDKALAAHEPVYMEPRDNYNLEIYGHYDTLRVGDVIEVRYPRYGMHFGARLIMLGINRKGNSESVEIEAFG
jgi:hypothetical protein